MFNVMSMRSVKDHTLPTTLRLSVVNKTSGFMTVLFISIDQMPFLARTIGNADPLFVLLITPCFDLHHVKVADQDQASGSLYADTQTILYFCLMYAVSVGFFTLRTADMTLK